MRPISPYPNAGVPSELPVGTGGIEVFDAPEALTINRARMEHLDSMGLSLDGKSLLDVGCGVGHLARFFLERRCSVTCLDGRPENIQVLKGRLPGVPAHVARLETDPLTLFGRFEIIFCYGLLYHLENPIAGLRNLASACDELLLLETVISDHELPVVRLLDEPAGTVNQALGGFGCRPTPAFVAMALSRAGFDFIYSPVTAPDHPDFQFAWMNNLDHTRNDHLLRCIFVASRRELSNPQLRLMLSTSGPKAQSSFLPSVAPSNDRVWLDVGAHLGEKTFPAAEKDSNLRVYAFEPNLRVATHKMGQLSNFVTLPMAVAEHDGSADFHVNTFDAASSLCGFVPEGLEQWIGKELLREEQIIPVPTIRLDTFLNHAGIQHVEFLKIDAQGADLAVVKSCGLRLSDIDRIQLEVQITELPLYRNAAVRDEVIQYLEGAGFVLDDSEIQSHGQEENLTFVRFGNQDPAAIVHEARALSILRPLTPWPGWYFGIDWNDPDPLLRKRKRIWNFCRQRHLELPLDFPWFFDLHLTLYLGNDTSRTLFIGGAVDPNEFSFLDRFLQPGMVVVDAGANEGLYTTFAAHRVGAGGKVLAFEPSTREMERLRLNIERNSLSNVTTYPVALGAETGDAVLHVAAGDHSGQNTLGAFAYSDVDLLRDEHVAVRPLDEIVGDTQLHRLDLLKMDVEGSEVRLLLGAAETIRKCRPLLLFEASDEALHKQNSSRDELLRLIESYGYLLYAFDPASGLPALAEQDDSSANLVAAPAENPLAPEYCARPRGATRQLDLLSGESALFNLLDHHPCNNSEVSGVESISIVTRPDQWSYAVVFPIREEARRLLGPSAEIVVQMKVEIEHGEIGIGIVGADGSTYLVSELRYDATRQPVGCEFTISYLPPGSAVVVRNSAANGTQSRAAIHSLSTFVAHWR